MNDIKFGIYVSPHGKLKYFYEEFDERVNQNYWKLDTGLKKASLLFRFLKIPFEHQMNVGYPVFEEAVLLKNCEYLGEL